jgi:hypothetical protein
MYADTRRQTSRTMCHRTAAQFDNDERAVALNPDGVGDDGVEMNMQIQTRAEALDRNHGASVRAFAARRSWLPQMTAIVFPLASS